jgi:Glycosyltransferase
MKNILFLHSSSELYGSDRSLLNLIKNLDKSNFNIAVVLPEDGPLLHELKRIDNVDVIIKEIAVLRRKNLSIKGFIQYARDFLKSLIFLKNIIKRKKIDIVYTNTAVVFSGGIIAKLLGKKSIWHIREIISNRYERKVISIIVNMFSDIIIANSKATKNAISNNEKKVKVIYNAIESKQIKLPDREKNIKDEIIIGMAGRINRWKGQKLFVDMAERVIKENFNVKFLIAGDVYRGESHILEDLKGYIDSKNLREKIILLGQVNDMNSFYNSLDIFILPSIQPEPFGLVVIEAMDRGIPVIATNHGGPVEIIDNGKNGYLVDYKDSLEMCQRVVQLINNEELRYEIGEKGKEKRNKVFNIENYVQNIENVLINI